MEKVLRLSGGSWEKKREAKRSFMQITYARGWVDAYISKRSRRREAQSRGWPASEVRTFLKRGPSLNHAETLLMYLISPSCGKLNISRGSWWLGPHGTYVKFVMRFIVHTQVINSTKFKIIYVFAVRVWPGLTPTDSIGCMQDCYRNTSHKSTADFRCVECNMWAGLPCPMHEAIDTRCRADRYLVQSNQKTLTDFAR